MVEANTIHPGGMVETPPTLPGSLLFELQRAVNRASVESVSNTPDFVLARYLRDCLGAWDVATRDRERWYGVKLTPGRRAHPSDAEATRLVFEAVGTASMCWENVAGAGVFQDGEATVVANRLLAALGFETSPAGGPADGQGV